MLNEIFYWIFNMSITAAVTGLLVLAVRSIKRLPKRFTVLLWAIPFLRMIVPFGVNSPYSLMSLLSKITTKTVIVYEASSKVSFSSTNFIMATDSYFPVTYKTNIVENLFKVASVIWIAAAVIFLAVLIINYFLSLKEIKSAELFKDNVYFSKKVTTPAVYGIIKPKIILPYDLHEGDIEVVLIHEKMHIRRMDNLFRIIALFILTLHWFNPVCWLFLKLFLNDIELACDECVLLKLGEERKKEYALSLLKNGEKKTVFASAFGGAKMRTRIENILSFKRLTAVSAIAFIAFIFGIFYLTLTNAV